MAIKSRKIDGSGALLTDFIKTSDQDLISDHFAYCINHAHCKILCLWPRFEFIKADS